ncbi:MAG: PilZ domain-containing protein [Candidatus Omnitrophota bacterium]
MSYSFQSKDLRQDVRVDLKVPVQINIGEQFTLQGVLKDLSLKSAFIIMKASVYFKINDEVGFLIQCTPGNAKDVIHGKARISRLAPGEGFVIYFTSMDHSSEARLKKSIGV